MASLRKLNLIEALNEQVLGNRKPYLGICLGLQFLAQEGFEYGSHQGLGWIQGSVQKIVPNETKYRIPHIGWNDLKIEQTSSLFQGLPSNPIFYFVHSYHLVVEQQDKNLVTATCWHGGNVTASIQQDNILGVQFHPEKSQQAGLQLLRNFVKLFQLNC